MHTKSSNDPIINIPLQKRRIHLMKAGAVEDL